MKAALILDNPKRDLLGLVLTAYQMLKMGADVYIVPMYNQGYDIPLIAPDVIVVNYVRPTNQKLLEGYRALGAIVIVMDTEGGVLSEASTDSPENWAKNFKAADLSRCVDYYFFWGPRLHDAFHRFSGLPAERLRVTGCPRYDLCHARWRRAIGYPRAGYVLINTNFSALNPAFSSSPDAEVEVFRDVGWEHDYVEQLYADLRRVFPRYLDTIERLVTANPDKTFVLRPHPFENAAFYRERFARNSNVLVDADGIVLNAIGNADCIVHLNCGTAVETALMGKVPLSMEFLNTATMRRHAPLPSTISCRAETFDDLNALVNDPALRAKRYATEVSLERDVTPWFHRVDGDAGLRVAAGALAAYRQKTTRRARRSILRSVTGGQGRPSWLQLVQGIGCNLVGSRLISAMRSLAQPSRAGKTVGLSAMSAEFHKVLVCDEARRRAQLTYARHPLTRAPLASVRARLQPV